MKRTVLIFLALCSLMLCSCDFFRGLAGRPLSADIEAKREKIELMLRQKEQQRLDSLARIRSFETDSLAAVAKLAELSAVILEAGSLGGLVEQAESGYCVVVGSFKNGSNAVRLAEKLSGNYDAKVRAFNNGMFAVTLCDCRSIVPLAGAYEKILNEKFCPTDVWILKN
ncbi:MAG: SPOR domain-containing protein [Candidatus Cryptobacteroides sp.]